MSNTQSPEERQEMLDASSIRVVNQFGGTLHNIEPILTVIQPPLIPPTPPVVKPFNPFYKYSNRASEGNIDDFCFLMGDHSLCPRVVGLSLSPLSFCCGVSIFGGFTHQGRFYIGRTPHFTDAYPKEVLEYWSIEENYKKAMESCYKDAVRTALLLETSEFRATISLYNRNNTPQDGQLPWFNFLLEKGWKIEHEWNSFKTRNNIYNLVWRDERTKNLRTTPNANRI